MCITSFDAYFALTVFFVFIGFMWVVFLKNISNKLQDIPKEEWKVIKSQDTLNNSKLTNNEEKNLA